MNVGLDFGAEQIQPDLDKELHEMVEHLLRCEGFSHRKELDEATYMKGVMAYALARHIKILGRALFELHEAGKPLHPVSIAAGMAGASNAFKSLAVKYAGEGV